MCLESRPFTAFQLKNEDVLSQASTMRASTMPKVRLVLVTRVFTVVVLDTDAMPRLLLRVRCALASIACHDLVLQASAEGVASSSSSAVPKELVELVHAHCQRIKKR